MKLVSDFVPLYPRYFAFFERICSQFLIHFKAVLSFVYVLDADDRSAVFKIYVGIKLVRYLRVVRNFEHLSPSMQGDCLLNNPHGPGIMWIMMILFSLGCVVLNGISVHVGRSTCPSLAGASQSSKPKTVGQLAFLKLNGLYACNRKSLDLGLFNFVDKFDADKWLRMLVMISLHLGLQLNARKNTG